MVLSNLFLAIGPGQIAVIAILVLLLFGGKKIPELMKGLGTGIKEFKKGVKEDETKKNTKEDFSSIFFDKYKTTIYFTSLLIALIDQYHLQMIPN